MFGLFLLPALFMLNTQAMLIDTVMNQQNEQQGPLLLEYHPEQPKGVFI
jgi:hypothetical protein